MKLAEGQHDQGAAQSGAGSPAQAEEEAGAKVPGCCCDALQILLETPQIIPTQSTSTHCSQAYGADVMRMWSATADYSKDVTVSRHTTFSHAIAC